MGSQPPPILRIFRETCVEYRRLSNEPLSESQALTGDSSQQLRYLLRHPFKFTRAFAQILFTGLTSLNALEVFAPVEKMVWFLRGYQVHELEALKKVTELNVRSHRDRITGNPFVRIGVPVGAIYGILSGARELLPDAGDLSGIRAVLQSQFLQELLTSWLIGLTIGAILMVLQYFFFIIPNLQRAQILDDIVAIALENLRLTESELAEKAE